MESRAAYPLLTRPTAQAAASANVEFDCPVDELAVDIEVTAVGGVSPSITFSLERQTATGRWVAMHTFGALTAPGSLSTSIGPGLTVPSLPTGRLRLAWAMTGTTPTADFNASVVGR